MWYTKGTKEREVNVMYNVYDCEQSFFIRGMTADFRPTSPWEHLKVMSDDEVMEYEKRLTFTNFNCLWDYVNGDNGLRNVKTGKTIFGQRYIFFDNLWGEGWRVKEKNFTEVVIWFHCLERNNISMKRLSSELPADDFLKFLNCRGITTIAMGE